MKIYFLGKVLECKRDINCIIDMLNEIEELATESNYVISHLEVDGEKVFDDFQSYFSKNIDDIKKVKVITKTPIELARDLILYMGDVIDELLPEVNIIANNFRKNLSKDALSRLVNVFGGIKWILDTFAALDSEMEIKHMVVDYKLWNEFAKDCYCLREIMVEIQDILMNDDDNYLPEVLSDEIAPLLEDMKDKLDSLVDRKIDLNKLN